MQDIWKKIDAYAPLSEESRQAWESILRKKTYRKNEYFVREGQIPRTVAFVVKGLFSQYHTAGNGDVIIKKFFPESYFIASLSALLLQAPSLFTIKALENSTVMEHDFHAFKQLVKDYADIAAVYIRYLELHWIIEKEPQEISLRYDSAKTRYMAFLQSYPALEPRLKQHEIAAYLGITPTQLSRIRAEL